ncbi:TIGR03084 family metal-binding protein [Rhodococcus sp. BE178]|uniref:TIGR03084 family metal-binding protein n=1 Tax=Rhodococcus sp. BE178 TaxID=2817737 RepID=UPI003D20E2F2
MALDYPALLDELRQESDGLVELLHGAEDFDLATPAAGWAIRDQISHLAYFDDAAVSAIRTPDRFRVDAAELIADGMDFPDRIAVTYREIPAAGLLDWFVQARQNLLATLGEAEPRARIPWYGPEMSIASMATARLMETWAHGQDVYDAVRLPHPANPGLRSIAHLGVGALPFVHTLNGLEVPADPVRVELIDPITQVRWVWGPESATNTVAGPAEDFVLAVTQRRNVADTALTVTGAVATAWMRIAQAYAGAPGAGRDRAATTATPTGDPT